MKWAASLGKTLAPAVDIEGGRAGKEVGLPHCCGLSNAGPHLSSPSRFPRYLRCDIRRAEFSCLHWYHLLWTPMHFSTPGHWLPLKSWAKALLSCAKVFRQYRISGYKNTICEWWEQGCAHKRAWVCSHTNRHVNPFALPEGSLPFRVNSADGTDNTV